jgi:hypothetical protein
VGFVHDSESLASGRVSAPPEFNAQHPPYPSSSRASSVYSGHSSNGSNASGASWSFGKKGVKKHPTKSKQRKHDLHLRPFVCTFGCPQYFRYLYEWKRHETSKHTQEELWICNNPVFCYLPGTCPYDLVPSPSADHLALHRHEDCVRRHDQTRTFKRRDGFLEHLRNWHRVTDTDQIEKIIESWKGTASLIPSDGFHCGFCGQIFANWDDRVAHVGEHFKKGKQFVDWWPARKDNTAGFTELLIHDAPIDFNPAQPVNCLSCGALFDTLWIAQECHDICRLYSCRFLAQVEGKSSHAIIHGAHCIYCGKWNEGFQRPHFEVAHNFRGCKQHMFISEQKFRLHLMDVHSGSLDISNDLSSSFSKPHLEIKPVFAPCLADSDPKCRSLEELHVGVGFSDSGDMCECELYTKIQQGYGGLVPS